MATQTAPPIEIDGRRYAPARRRVPLRAWWRAIIGVTVMAAVASAGTSAGIDQARSLAVAAAAGAVVALAGPWMLISGAGHAALAVTAATGATIRASTVGGRRHWWWPAWFLAGAALPIPYATALWLALAVAAGARPAFQDRESLTRGWGWLAGRRRVLSARELGWLSRACALTAAWHTYLNVMPTRTAAVTLPAAILGCAVPWWHSRRARPGGTNGFPSLWAAVVVPAHPKTAGEWVSWDDDAGSGVLELADAKAADVARMDEDVETTLDRAGIPMRRGMVTISADPTLTVRQVRVVLSSSPEEMASRSRMWDGPTLGDPDGRGNLRRPGMYLLAVTKTGQEQWVMHRDVTNGRARFAVFVGPTGVGKGGAMRIDILESAVHPLTLLIIADGKWGAGLGYCRAGTAQYADSADAVSDQSDRVIRLIRDRAARYGREGRDSFTPQPGEPQIRWVIDELPRILASSAGRKVAAALNEISAIGGSLGITFVAAQQRSDAASWGWGTEATTTRTNVMGGGYRWIGPSDDAEGHRSNEQNSKLDATALPRNGGWCYVLERDPAPAPARGLWIPNRRDVTEKGHSAPHGTVEDWLESRTVHPELRDAEHVILLAAPLAGASPTPPTPDPDLVREPGAPCPAVTNAAGETTARDAIRSILADADSGLTRQEIRISAEERYGITVTNRRVSQILEDLERKHQALNDDARWRAA